MRNWLIPSVLIGALTRKAFLIAILMIFFVSGACGLVYEVAWLKMLGIILGSTSLATATILAAFMAGMGIGSFVFGRIADTHPGYGLRIYALLELGIGVFAFIMPLVLGWLDEFYVFLYRNVTSGYSGLSVIRLVLSIMVLLFPTMLMGGTLPVVLRFLNSQFGNFSRNVSLLYFINTFGAAIGTIVTGFVLIAFLGVNQSAYIAGILNILIAALAFFLSSRQTREVPVKPSVIGFSSSGGESEPPFIHSVKTRRVIIGVLAVSGFCSLSYEVLWTRALIYILDNTTQAFTTMLSAFLVGIALGSLIVSRWLGKSRNLVGWLAAVEISIGLLALLSIPVFGNIGANLGVGPGNIYYPTDNQLGWALFRFARSFLVMLLPTVLMGFSIPMAIQIFFSGPDRVGNSVGRALAVNTLGGVLGAFGTGLVLIPWLGVYKSVMLVAGVNVIIGLVLIGFGLIRYRWKILALSTATVSYFITLIILLSYGSVVFSSPVERENLAEILYYNEGIGATVKVYQDYFMDKSISIDGFPVAGTITRHVDAQKSLGNLPLLLNQKDNPTIGVIGFGAGGSSWAALQYDTQYVDCVELVPAVLKAAEYIPEVNHGVMADSRLNVILGDGRNYMLVSDKTYDIISVDATSPKSAGSGNLYTREFYELCQDNLADDGLMVQWLPYHLLSEEDVKLTIRTFQQVFPHATLWSSFDRYYFILVGTRQTLSLDFNRLEYWMSQPQIKAELEPMGILDAFDVAACFLADEITLTDYVGGGRLNTDNNPYLEYDPASSYLVIESSIRDNLKAAVVLRQSVWPYLHNTGQTLADINTNKTEFDQRFAQTTLDHYFPQYLD